MTTALIGLLILVSPQPQSAGEVPRGWEPAPTPISWELSLKFLDPQRIEVGGQTYWYMVYTVTNNSGTTRYFYPTFQFVSEDLQVIDTDMGISPAVFAAIRERHQITHPDLVPPTKAIGDVLVGEDNARESVAIWPQFDLRVNNFAIYVAGLSGETRLVTNPQYDSKRPEESAVIGPDGRSRQVRDNPRNFTLRKTLEVRYHLPGSPGLRESAPAERQAVRWLMR